jgi:hypothetical protein
MNKKMSWRGVGFIAAGIAAWSWVAAHPVDEREQITEIEATSVTGGSRGTMAVTVAQTLGPAIERALARYFESRGVEFAPSGELAGLILDEIGDVPEPEVISMPGEKIRYTDGRRLSAGEPLPQGAFQEDVELTLTETGSGSGDKVQLVFVTPEFDNDPVFRDAWSIVVDAEDSARPDDGTMFFSTPSFADALQLFTDGSAVVPELRYLNLRRLASPPFACTSLQEGSFYWDDSISELCDCDGTAWEPVDSSSSNSCT